MASAVPTLSTEHSGALIASYRAALAARRMWTLLGLVMMAAAIAVSAWSAEVDLAKLWKNLATFSSYIIRLFTLDTGKPVWTDVVEWYWGLGKWTLKLAETLVIAYVGTVMGAVGALALCFGAADNLVSRKTSLFLSRRALEVCRTVPEIVFALIFVVAFGLGPMAGVLALAIHTMGALGKQFAEVVENVDMKPFEGLTATGATWTEAVRFAVIPQVLSNFMSYGLLRFEINVRGAAVMGFVGAGGIGQDLLEAIRKFYYSDVSAMLLLIIATVMVIDLVTEKLRHRLIGLEQR